MQLTTLLVETIKSGKVIVEQNNVPQLEITAANKKIDINATDKKLIKDVISSARQATSKKGVTESIKRSISGIKTAQEMRPLLKEIAEDFCKEGVTITVSYKGDRVMTIGSEADSKLTRLVTGTKGIEINSPIKLAEMGI